MTQKGKLKKFWNTLIKSAAIFRRVCLYSNKTAIIFIATLILVLA